MRKLKSKVKQIQIKENLLCVNDSPFLYNVDAIEWFRKKVLLYITIYSKFGSFGHIPLIRFKLKVDKEYLVNVNDSTELIIKMINDDMSLVKFLYEITTHCDWDIVQKHGYPIDKIKEWEELK